MEEKNTNMEDSQEPTEKMECDEKPTRSESIPELTENTNSKKATGTEEKPKPSITSKTTSGIDLESKPSTSALESPRKTGKLASTPKPSTMTSKTTSGIELESKPSTSGLGSPRKTEKNKRSNDPTVEFSPTRKLLRDVKDFFSPSKDSKSKQKTVTKPKENRSEYLSPSDKSPTSKNIVNPEEACSSKGEEDKNKPASNPIAESSPTRKLLRDVKGFFSSSKDSKSKQKTGTKPKESHSESLSPSGKSLISKDIVNPEEACTSKGEEENFIKRLKNNVVKSVEGKLHNILPRVKSPTSSETATLVCEEVTGQTENAPKNVEMAKTDLNKDEDLNRSISQWINRRRRSLSSDPSYDSPMTDTSSLSSTAAFSGEMSIKPSETAENTLAEAVADSPPGSSEEVPEVQDDKYLDSSKK